MNDQEWISAAKEKFSYQNPILPVWYTAEACNRRADAFNNHKGHEWQDGDLDREKTKARMADMGLDVSGL